MHDRALLFESCPEWLHVLRLVVEAVNEDHFGGRHGTQRITLSSAVPVGDRLMRPRLADWLQSS